MKYITKTIKIIDPNSLREDVKMLGINQRKMAEEVGVSPATVCRWIKGTESVPEKYFKPIEKYINNRKKLVTNYISQ